jgi:ubiquinone/menaquinone biosynthesis C-methylase UbiE
MSGVTGPEKMDLASRSALKDVYPVIARQIIFRTSATGGVCVDIGTGPASLAMAVAKLGDFKVFALDISGGMCAIARKNVLNEAIGDRVFPIMGDVHSLPFEDNSADLVISRGSMFFWHDKVKAFREIHRILKPNGRGYIGGGLGGPGLKAAADITDNTATDDVRKRMGVNDLYGLLGASGVPDHDVINDASGLWVILKK